MARTKWHVIFTIVILLLISCDLRLKSLASESAAATQNLIAIPPEGALIVPENYSTIQAAIDNASAGDTVFVKRGIYNYSGDNDDAIRIDKPLSLIGEDSQKTVITRAKYRYAIDVIGITADDVTISGFTITSDYIGVRIENGSHSSDQPSGIKIIGNNIVSRYEGIITYGGENYIISQNNITGNLGHGIYIASSNSNVSDNNISGNIETGMIINSCTNVNVSGNNITGNGNGLNLGWGSSFYVHGNNITDNQGYGIQFSEGCNNATVYQNNIMLNGIGFNLLNFPLVGNANLIGSGNQFYNNNLIGNAQNAFVERTFINNGIEGFIGNGTDVVSWDNGKVGNYWSDYRSKYPNATQIDASGIGSIPYIIDENNVDHYPLVQQVDTSAPVPIATPSSTSGIWLGVPSLTIAIIIAGSLAVLISLVIYRTRHKRPKLMVF
jgi:parallel beta-helix repeat protein